MKVKCINHLPIDKADCNYPDLTPGNVYDVLEISYNRYRIIGNEGKPYLYATRRFETVDDRLGDDWKKRIDGEYIHYAPEDFGNFLLSDYFDYKKKAIKTFNRYAQKKFERTVGKLEAIKSHPHKNRE